MGFIFMYVGFFFDSFCLEDYFYWSLNYFGKIYCIYIFGMEKVLIEGIFCFVWF